MAKRFLAALLCLCAVLLAGCSLPAEVQGMLAPVQSEPLTPDLRLLSMPAYEAPAPAAQPDHDTLLRLDLWLDASPSVGGVNPSKDSIYPHHSRKYREGGFHYHFENTVGWYQNVLQAALTTVEDTRVRVLRVGTERLTDDYLVQSGVAQPNASPDALRSLRRDMLTYAIDPLPSVFDDLAAEKMEGLFYTPGTPMLARVDDLNPSALENPQLSQPMAAALDAQVTAIAKGEPGDLLASGDDADYALLYALDNIDTDRLSFITCDPAAIRRLTVVDADGLPVHLISDALDRRGVFDRGLSVGLYAFTLDYMGQIASFTAADLSEPLLWGRVDYVNATNKSAGALPMPRTLLALVIGTPAQVETFNAAFQRNLRADARLKELRGPQKGELEYMQNGQTVTQQPFGFAWEYLQVDRPAVACATQHTPDACLQATHGDVTVEDGLPLVTLSPVEGVHPDRTLTLSVPAPALPDGVTVALDRPSAASLQVTAALMLDHTAQNLPDAPIVPDTQTIALRDTLYVYAYRTDPFADGASPFALQGVQLHQGKLRFTMTVDGDTLRAGRYRLLLCADLPGDGFAWVDVPWTEALNAEVSNAEISQWVAFTELITEYGRLSDQVPRQFTHAWGPLNERGYRETAIPDFPPVQQAPELRELIAQMRSSARPHDIPYVHYVLDVFVTADGAQP